MADKPDWVKFSPSDWLLDPAVMGMTWVQRGAYIHLLMIQACEGSLPKNTDSIRRLLGMSVQEWRRVWPALADQFPEKGDGRINSRMEKAIEPWARMSAGGKKGSPSKALPKPIESPSKPLGVDLDLDLDLKSDNKNDLDTKKIGDGGAKRTRPSARGGLGWDEDKKRLMPTDEFIKDFQRVWLREFTKPELEEAIKAFTRWYSRPKQRARRLNAKARHDQALHNWMEITYDDRKTLEAVDATVRKTPEPEERKLYCDKCRNKLPNHMKWCPEVKK